MDRPYTCMAVRPGTQRARTDLRDLAAGDADRTGTLLNQRRHAAGRRRGCLAGDTSGPARSPSDVDAVEVADKDAVLLAFGSSVGRRVVMRRSPVFRMLARLFSDPTLATSTPWPVPAPRPGLRDASDPAEPLARADLGTAAASPAGRSVRVHPGPLGEVRCPRRLQLPDGLRDRRSGLGRGGRHPQRRGCRRLRRAGVRPRPARGRIGPLPCVDHLIYAYLIESTGILPRSSPRWSAGSRWGRRWTRRQTTLAGRGRRRSCSSATRRCSTSAG